VTIGIALVYFILRGIIYAFGETKSNNYSFKYLFWLNLTHNIALPIVKFKNTLILLIKGKNRGEESRQEIHELFESALEEGSLNDKEYAILTNIMNFSEILVSDVMTPHTVIFSCNANSKVKDIIDLPPLQVFSRFPIWEGESIDDRVVGYVLTKDVFKAALNHQENKTLKEFAQDVYFIPETASVSTALEKFLQRRQHLFVVVDEYGAVSGLITMEDVLETILGEEIMDEADRISDLRKYAAEKRNERVNLLTSKL
jgi:CBS domain containing-hemolysin-like protein